MQLRHFIRRILADIKNIAGLGQQYLFHYVRNDSDALTHYALGKLAEK